MGILCLWSQNDDKTIKFRIVDNRNENSNTNIVIATGLRVFMKLCEIALLQPPTILMVAEGFPGCLY